MRSINQGVADIAADLAGIAATSKLGPAGALVAPGIKGFFDVLGKTQSKRAEKAALAIHQEVERLLAEDLIDAANLTEWSEEHKEACLHMYLQAVQAPDSSVTPIFARLVAMKLQDQKLEGVDLTDIGTVFEKSSKAHIEAMRTMFAAASEVIQTGVFPTIDFSVERTNYPALGGTWYVTGIRSEDGRTTQVSEPVELDCPLVEVTLRKFLSQGAFYPSEGTFGLAGIPGTTLARASRSLVEVLTNLVRP